MDERNETYVIRHSLYILFVKYSCWWPSTRHSEIIPESYCLEVPEWIKHHFHHLYYITYVMGIILMMIMNNVLSFATSTFAEYKTDTQICHSSFMKKTVDMEKFKTGSNITSKSRLLYHS